MFIAGPVFPDPGIGSVPTSSGSVLTRSVWFHYGSVPSRFGSYRFRFGFGQVGSVPLRFGSMTVRFQIPPGSVLAVPVRFHHSSVLVGSVSASRFGSAAIL